MRDSKIQNGFTIVRVNNGAGLYIVENPIMSLRNRRMYEIAPIGGGEVIAVRPNDLTIVDHPIRRITFR